MIIKLGKRFNSEFGSVAGQIEKIERCRKKQNLGKLGQKWIKRFNRRNSRNG